LTLPPVAIVPFSPFTLPPVAVPSSSYTLSPAVFPSSTYSTSPAASPQADNSYTQGFIFTNSYASSSCSGEILFSFGDYLGGCTNDTSSSTSYLYLIDTGKKKIRIFLNCEQC